jgi:MFS family permease
MMSLSFPQRDQNRRLLVLAIVGAVVLAFGVGFSPIQTWSNLLLVAFFLLTVGLGGAMFVALTYITGAGWHVAFRRVPEAMARILPLAGAAMLLVLAVRMKSYGWHHHGEGDAGTFWFKEYWLTTSFWFLRAIAYVVIWSLLASWLVARSRRQDQSGNVALTAGNVRLSALFLAVYAATFSLASVDWIMALEPMWFSTMWGVYNFAGMIQASLAVVIMLGLLLRSHDGPLHGIFNDEHLHDLGKLMLGFSCFWMYIWFSQCEHSRGNIVFHHSHPWCLGTDRSGVDCPKLGVAIFRVAAQARKAERECHDEDRRRRADWPLG